MRLRAIGLLAVLAALQGCHRAPEPVRPAPARPAQAARLGFALQAGAFAKVENAARLAERLQGQGLDATYFAAPDGLFKVRFGDFRTREAARAKAEALVKAGVIEVFFVVAPAPPPPMEGQDASELRASLAKSAASYLGVPYLWGGTTSDGFDCSGLTWAVYRLNGLGLPRSSQAQWGVGRPVERDQLRTGDLVFFATGKAGRVSHVGLYTGQGRFIHASREGDAVREDRLDGPYFRERYLGGRSLL